MSTELRWEIEGDPELAGAVLLDQFRLFLDQLAAALRATEQDIAEASQPSAVYVITQLSCASPAQVSMAAPRYSPEGERVICAMKRNLRALNGGNRPGGISDATLDTYARLSPPRDAGTVSLRLLDDGDDLALPHDWYSRVRRLRTPAIRYETSFRGVLTDLSVRTRRAKLEIPFHPYVVRCYIRKHAMRDAKAALEEWADISGTAHRTEGSADLDYFTVSRIEILPPTTDLPTAEQVFGSMPELTNGLGAAAYLKELRDADE